MHSQDQDKFITFHTGQNSELIFDMLVSSLVFQKIFQEKEAMSSADPESII